METCSLKWSANSHVRSRYVSFDPIVREIPVSIQGEPLKGWTTDSDTKPMKGIPLDIEKETGATLNSFQRYNGLKPRARYGSFNPIVEEISGQTKVLPAQGEDESRPHTAPERVFSRELFFYTGFWIRGRMLLTRCFSSSIGSDSLQKRITGNQLARYRGTLLFSIIAAMK